MNGNINVTMGQLTNMPLQHLTGIGTKTASILRKKRITTYTLFTWHSTIVRENNNRNNINDVKTRFLACFEAKGLNRNHNVDYSQCSAIFQSIHSLVEIHNQAKNLNARDPPNFEDQTTRIRRMFINYGEQFEDNIELRTLVQMCLRINRLGRADNLVEIRIYFVNYLISNRININHGLMIFEHIQLTIDRNTGEIARWLQPIDVQPNDAQPIDVQPNDAQPIDVQPNDAQPIDVQPNDVQPNDAQPIDVVRQNTLRDLFYDSAVVWEYIEFLNRNYGQIPNITVEDAPVFNDLIARILEDGITLRDIQTVGAVNMRAFEARNIELRTLVQMYLITNRLERDDNFFERITYFVNYLRNNRININHGLMIFEHIRYLVLIYTRQFINDHRQDILNPEGIQNYRELPLHFLNHIVNYILTIDRRNIDHSTRFLVEIHNQANNFNNQAVFDIENLSARICRDMTIGQINGVGAVNMRIFGNRNIELRTLVRMYLRINLLERDDNFFERRIYFVEYLKTNGITRNHGKMIFEHIRYLVLISTPDVTQFIDIHRRNALRFVIEHHRLSNDVPLIEISGIGPRNERILRERGITTRILFEEFLTINRQRNQNQRELRLHFIDYIKRNGVTKNHGTRIFFDIHSEVHNIKIQLKGIIDEFDTIYQLNNEWMINFAERVNNRDQMIQNWHADFDRNQRFVNNDVAMNCTIAFREFVHLFYGIERNRVETRLEFIRYLSEEIFPNLHIQGDFSTFIRGLFESILKDLFENAQ